MSRGKRWGLVAPQRGACEHPLEREQHRGALLRRRSLLAGSAAALAAGAVGALGLWPSEAAAMGRIALAGELRLRVPWSLGEIDPHDLLDPVAALFGHALADPVFALDRQGQPYPTLAHGLPRIEDGQTVVRLRPGLRTARNKELTGRDLAWSVTRARNMGAAGWLGPLTGSVRSSRKDPLAARFGRIDPGRLAVLLASPLVALLPKGFRPRAPDGTGAFVAHCHRQRLVLLRNERAARGPSYLDRVTVRSSADLAASLRAFESGRDDLGWHGMGLHGPRPGAQRFDFGQVGWIVLATGKTAGRFGMAGVAQQLADAVPVDRLGHLGLQRRHQAAKGVPWGGGKASILVDEGAGQLVGIARAAATHLSRPGHELEVRAVPRSRLRRSLARDEFELAVHAVRNVAPGPVAAHIALATADRAALGRDVARHPPRHPATTRADELTRSLRVGVLGTLSVRGGVARGVELVAASPQGMGLDLCSSYRSG